MVAGNGCASIFAIADLCFYVLWTVMASWLGFHEGEEVKFQMGAELESGEFAATFSCMA